MRRTIGAHDPPAGIEGHHALLEQTEQRVAIDLFPAQVLPDLVQLAREAGGAGGNASTWSGPDLAADRLQVAPYLTAAVDGGEGQEHDDHGEDRPRFHGSSMAHPRGVPPLLR